jgi:DNA-binding NarL/FixJ family response regulator
VRAGLASLLTTAGVDVCATVGEAEALREAVRELRPDLAIIDIRMPPSNTDEGVRAALDLRAEHPQLGILLLSQRVETRHAARLLAAGPGGFGYLLTHRRVLAVLAYLGRPASG